MSSFRADISVSPGYSWCISIDVVDIVIVIAALLGLVNGWRRGLLHSTSQYAGMVVGVVGGAALATPILNRLDVYNPDARPIAAALLMLLAGSLGSTLGFWLGDPLRRAFLGRSQAHALERVGGAALSTIMVVCMAWFLGLTFDRGPSPQLALLIQRSAILRSLSAVAPSPPGFLSAVEQTLAGVPFPQTFAGLEPPPRPLPIPSSADTAAVTGASSDVFRVVGRGCGGLVTGSAFPIAPGYLITDAHVVSGTVGTEVVRDNPEETFPASVVLFDPDRDIAILYAPGVTAQALQTAPGGRGTRGAVIGYPGGGPELVVPAVIDSQMAATGRDIYDQNLVTRQIWTIGSSVHQGDSGGPLINLKGQVLGMVFAVSTTDPSQAYALTDSELASDERAGIGRKTGINTGAYACAV